MSKLFKVTIAAWFVVAVGALLAVRPMAEQAVEAATGPHPQEIDRWAFLPGGRCRASKIVSGRRTLGWITAIHCASGLPSVSPGMRGYLFLGPDAIMSMEDMMSIQEVRRAFECKRRAGFGLLAGKVVAWARAGRWILAATQEGLFRPGDSGSVLYDPESGRIVGVLSSIPERGGSRTTFVSSVCDVTLSEEMVQLQENLRKLMEAKNRDQ